MWSLIKTSDKKKLERVFAPVKSKALYSVFCICAVLFFSSIAISSKSLDTGYPWSADSAAVVGRYLAVRTCVESAHYMEEEGGALAIHISEASVAPHSIQPVALKSIIPSEALGFYGGNIANLQSVFPQPQVNRWNNYRLEIHAIPDISHWEMDTSRWQKLVDRYNVSRIPESSFLVADTWHHRIAKQQYRVISSNMHVTTAWQNRLLETRANVAYDITKPIVGVFPGGSLGTGLFEATKPGLTRVDQMKLIGWGVVGEVPGLRGVSTAKSVWDLKCTLPNDLYNLQQAHRPLTLTQGFAHSYNNGFVRSYTEGTIIKTYEHFGGPTWGFEPGKSAFKITTESSYTQRVFTGGVATIESYGSTLNHIPLSYRGGSMSPKLGDYDWVHQAIHNQVSHSMSLSSYSPLVMGVGNMPTSFGHNVAGSNFNLNSGLSSFSRPPTTGISNMPMSFGSSMIGGNFNQNVMMTYRISTQGAQYGR